MVARTVEHAESHRLVALEVFLDVALLVKTARDDAECHIAFGEDANDAAVLRNDDRANVPFRLTRAASANEMPGGAVRRLRRCMTLFTRSSNIIVSEFDRLRGIGQRAIVVASND